MWNVLGSCQTLQLPKTLIVKSILQESQAYEN